MLKINSQLYNINSREQQKTMKIVSCFESRCHIQTNKHHKKLHTYLFSDQGKPRMRGFPVKQELLTFMLVPVDCESSDLSWTSRIITTIGVFNKFSTLCS